TPLLQAPSAFQSAVDQMLEQAAPVDYDVIAAPDARGFIFGVPMALRAGEPILPIRKPGKLPYSTVGYDYELEYGTDRLEMHVDAVPSGQRVLLVDDLLATGGTIRACGELIRKQGGVVAAYSFLIELGFLEGRSKLGDTQVNRVLSY
ncbi:MAG: adenine phosphoribosyltransferase, partial [Pirellulales bacterium]|nr:adenine phosphoribosyltransferase [Pirellulales bacterium]